MPTANIAALGSTRKMLGFSRRTVEFDSATVADVLRDLKTNDKTKQRSIVGLVNDNLFFES